jgi:hypothetical protein
VLRALAATIALAATPAPSTDATPAALSIAYRSWGTVACGGQVAVTWDDSMDRSLNAVSSWENAAGVYADPATNTDCRIALNPKTIWGWPKLCTVVVHEVGHLTGHRHTPEAPGSVMDPEYRGPLPECAPPRP